MPTGSSVHAAESGRQGMMGKRKVIVAPPGDKHWRNRKGKGCQYVETPVFKYLLFKIRQSELRSFGYHPEFSNKNRRSNKGLFILLSIGY